MLQKVQQTQVQAPGGGLVTLPNFFALKPTQTPNCMNDRFGLGGTIEKRLGITSLNTIAIAGAQTGGFGAFDFGRVRRGNTTSMAY